MIANSLFANSIHNIGSPSILATLIHAFTPLVILYSLDKLSNLIPHEVKPASYSTHSLGRGAFQQSSWVHHMSSCTVTMQLKKRNSTQQIYCLIQPKLFHFSQWTKLTLGMGKYSNQLLHIHSRRQALKDSLQFIHSRYQQILLKPINELHSIGPVSLSSMMK